MSLREPDVDGCTLFRDHHVEDDDLRATITAQLDDLEKAPVERRMRIAPPARRASRR
ncbi:hypothetical protein ACFV0O_13015 [Kitasatospora sp. NPDC059577]|uniref:hypothetical protein n=1 Tax=Kitasatospora sp. NPDC059577 TaxID=3346873 RepID=UPI00368889B6